MGNKLEMGKKDINNEQDLSAKPFLRWAGGKQWLTYILPASLPKFDGAYYEPFLGGAALYFNLHPQKSYLSDLNPELINTYIQVRDKVTDIIKQLNKLKFNKTTYNKIRSSNFVDPVEKAVRFIYLNRTCWNGLYRVNQKGEFNVPMGSHKFKSVCDEETLSNASMALKEAKIKVLDFETALKNTNKGDLVYLDPPYTTSIKPKSNGFISYNSKLFSLDDQVRLSQIASEISKKGTYVVVSNVDDPIITKLYKNFYTAKVYRNSTIAGITKNRKNISERLFANFPIKIPGE